MVALHYNIKLGLEKDGIHHYSSVIFLFIQMHMGLNKIGAYNTSKQTLEFNDFGLNGKIMQKLSGGALTQ